MKLKLFILACMLIIHVGADEMDVEYGDDYDDENEPAVFNEINTEEPVESFIKTQEESHNNLENEDPLTCSRNGQIYKDHEVIRSMENYDCQICKCENGKFECSGCAFDDEDVTSIQPVTEVEEVKDQSTEQLVEEDKIEKEDEEEVKEKVEEDEEEVEEEEEANKVKEVVDDKVVDVQEEDVQDEVKDVIDKDKELVDTDVQDRELEDSFLAQVQDSPDNAVEDDTNDAAEDIVEQDVNTESDAEIETTTNNSMEQKPQSSENVEEIQHHQSSENVDKDQNSQHVNQRSQSSENAHDNQQHHSSENEHEIQHHQNSDNVHDNQPHHSSENEHENQHHQNSDNVHDNQQHHQSPKTVHDNQQQHSSENVHDNQQHHQNSENAHDNQQQHSSENVNDNQQHHQISENAHDNQQHHQISENAHENQHHQNSNNVHDNHQTEYHENVVIGAHSMQSNNNNHYYENDSEYDDDDAEEEKHELPNYYDLPGPYCKSRYPRASNGKCCDDRLDSCSVPILSTLCYCDEFCDQHNNPDCCPDYQSHCKGMAPSPIIGCEVDGVYFTPFDPPQMINCNLCKCQQDGKALCEIDSCLSDTEMIKNINYDQDVSWTAKNYTEFFGRKYKEGLELRLGTFEPVRRVKSMSRLSNGQKQLPNSFNSLENWPGLISEVRDQGWCGSSWAVSTASVASDRFSVKSKGQEMVEMAPQQLLSCAKRQQGCNGGHLDIAWNYFRRLGGVDEDCYPYEAKVNTCRVPDKRQSTLRSLGCSLPTKVARTDLYKMGPAYSLNNETDIMSEIFYHGPVQATMRVYHDFFTYQTGVYSHTPFGADQRSGFHSVRLIGWGQEDNGYENLKYWIAANSWGKWWGEKGFFRILRGNNECEIENYVLSSLADIQDTKVNGRRGRNSRHNRH